jgi:DNA helicase-2/ATP-dependent DNA helicase PcrA
MTVHSAKGLEFPCVFVVGMEENLFPSIQSLNARADLEEERRLFYVAVTRAQQKLTLSYAENRYRWGTPSMCEPSRFISEIPQQFIDLPKKLAQPASHSFSGTNWSLNLPGLSPPSPKSNPPGNFKKISTSAQEPDSKLPEGPPSDYEQITTGMTVAHERFGNGKVVNIEGVGPNRKATVFFQSVGQKQLLLRFARLRIVK